MIAIITDRKTKQSNVIKSVVSAVTHEDYIAVRYINEDGEKDVDVFRYKDAEVQFLNEP